ncbi:MAG: GreA/GreB family elongation factor [bacterium]
MLQDSFSPVSQGLLGHKVNDMVNITTPTGMKLKYKILKISR